MSQTSTFSLTVTVTAIVSSRPVVACPNVGDAASPVTLHLGGYSRQIGQAADWRHNIAEAARQHGAECVTGYHCEGRYECRTTADETRVEAIIRERKAEIASREAAQAHRDEEARNAAIARDIAARLAARTQEQVDVDDAIVAARRVRSGFGRAEQVIGVRHIPTTTDGLRCVVEVRYGDGSGLRVPFGALDGQRVGVERIAA